MKRTRILYACFFAASLAYAYFNGGTVPYMLLYSVILLPVISFAYTIIIYCRFKYEQKLDKKAVTKGEPVNLTFRVSNEDFLIYPYIRVSFYGEESAFQSQIQSCSFSLKPFSKKSRTVKLRCRYRGRYEIGIKTIEFVDFFGLFSLRYRIVKPRHITVYPRIVKLMGFHLKTDFISESHAILSNKGEDMTTISDIRKYEYGDSLRRIHWKLTAKTSEIMVKKFQSTSETNAVIMLDLRRNSYDSGKNIMIEDKVIESVVAVLYFCLYNWIPVNMVFYSGKLYDIHAKNYMMFHEIFEILSKVEFNETVQLKDLLELYADNTLIPRANILLFTSNLDYGLCSQVYKTADSGLDVSIIYTSPQDSQGEADGAEEDILRSLPDIGVRCYRINSGDDDIEKILEG